jgi:hypothetical protein
MARLVEICGGNTDAEGIESLAKNIGGGLELGPKIVAFWTAWTGRESFRKMSVPLLPLLAFRRRWLLIKLIAPLSSRVTLPDFAFRSFTGTRPCVESLPFPTDRPIVSIDRPLVLTGLTLVT